VLPNMDNLPLSVDSVPDQANKDLSSLSRSAIGYIYEMDLQHYLDKLNVPYTANPRQYEEWLKHTSEGKDLVVCNISVEAKFTQTKLFHSWIMRDWVSRSASIIVTNNKFNVSPEDRHLLQLYGKSLMSTYEFLWYVIDLCKRGNKLSSLNIYPNSNYSNRSGPSIPKQRENKSLDEYLVKSGLDYGEDVVPKRTTRYSCYNCRKYEYCEILSRLRDIKAFKPDPRLAYEQKDLWMSKRDPPIPFKTRYKEWYKNYLKLIGEKEECLYKRTNIATHAKGYYLFNIDHSQIHLREDA
jgi:hypothetical protein